ncbi:MAG TPA: ABC transporter permease [Steroidobacteraceae bacterium]|nr:ABC transporter permease [Steroidobacteraceae bacterium]
MARGLTAWDLPPWLQRIRAVALKEFRQVLRDKLTLGMIVGIPLIQMMIFGYGINFDIREIRTGVVDEAHSSGSRALLADLQASQVLRVSETLPDVATLRAEIANGDVQAGIFIPADFERRRLAADRSLAQVFVDGSRPGLEGAVQALAAAAVPAREGVLPSRVTPLAVQVEYNPERRTAVQVVPALIGVILSMTMVVFTAIALVRERERGNLELLITTPVRSIELMVGKLTPYVLVGLLQTTIILLVGVLLFDVPVNGSLLSLYLGAGLFIAATLGLGLLISTVATTQFQAMQMGFFTLLPSILLSGFAFPFEGMPRPVQLLAQVLPLTHFVDIVRGVVLRGATLASLWWSVTKLGIFLCVSMSLAALRFRKRLD